MSIWVPLIKRLRSTKNRLICINKLRAIDPDSPFCYTVPAEVNLKIRNFDRALELIDIALEKIHKSDLKNSIHFPNAIKLKTEINVALKKDQENIEMLKIILRSTVLSRYILFISNYRLIYDR